MRLRVLLHGTVLSLLLGVWSLPALAHVQFDALDGLPPGEQYRQLSLMLLVSAAVAPELASALLAVVPDDGRSFNPDDYTTPLARIVNQQSLLVGAAQLIRFTGQNRPAIRARMDALAADNPVLISLLDPASLSEDTLLIRNAIADSIEIAGLGDSLAPAISAYREHTLRLRNMMEYEQFRAELDVLTGDAIASVGGKLDAYQRMFDAETVNDGFDRHIESAESIYKRTEKFDPKAAELTEEMLRNMILIESQPKR
jgi:hypothetical protein